MLRFFVVVAAMSVFIACGGQKNANEANEDHTHHDHDHYHDHDHDHSSHDKDKGDGVHFGLKEISTDGAISASTLVAQLDKKEGLTELTVGEEKIQGLNAAKIEGTITEVCQAAGCWFRMKTEEGKEVFIKMKEHKNIPIDWSGKTVVAQGDAFIKETSIEELRHYIDDEMKSDELTAAQKEALKKKKEAVKAPKMEYNLIAEGVVLKK